MAQDCKLVIIQVMDAYGYVTAADFASGVALSVWYQNTGRADRVVINFSGGWRPEYLSDEDENVIRDACLHADNNNVPLVTISGNNARENYVWVPGAYSDDYENVICVAATGPDDEHAPYSNAGSEVDVSAPGGHGEVSWEGPPYGNDPQDIWSTTPNYPDFTLNGTGGGKGYPVTPDYSYMWGTSQAAPHVAGIGALMLSRNPNLPDWQVKQIIRDTAEAKGDTMQFGTGRVSAYYALWNTPPGNPKMAGLERAKLPRRIVLNQNHPNPFNPVTLIRFELPRASEVELSIYNTTGQLVRRLAEGTYERGVHRLAWDSKDERGVDVASGVYFYRLEAGEVVRTRRMVLLR